MAGWTWRTSRSPATWRGAEDTPSISSAIRSRPSSPHSQGVHVHHVPRPLGIHRLGEPLLRSAARRESSAVWRPSILARVANGGNADLGDLNWVHYVHAAFEPPAAGLATGCATGGSTSGTSPKSAGARTRAAGDLQQQPDRRRCREAGRRRARSDEGRLLRDRSGQVRPSRASRARRVATLALAFRQTVVWRSSSARSAIAGRDSTPCSTRGWALCGRADWDVDLVVAGTGAELESWKARAARELPEGRMHFLGFRRDMPAVFAACDLLDSPGAV